MIRTMSNKNKGIAFILYNMYIKRQQNLTENFPYALLVLSRRRKPILTNCPGSTVLTLLGRKAVEGEGLLATGGRKTPYEREFGKTETDKIPVKYIFSSDTSSIQLPFQVNGRPSGNGKVA